MPCIVYEHNMDCLLVHYLPRLMSYHLFIMLLLIYVYENENTYFLRYLSAMYGFSSLTSPSFSSGSTWIYYLFNYYFLRYFYVWHTIHAIVIKIGASDSMTTTTSMTRTKEWLERWTRKIGIIIYTIYE